MRAVIQRVSSASVEIHGREGARIGAGLLVLAGIEEADSNEDVEWLAGKIVRLRVFNDESGVMNRSLHETGGDILVISQFTLHASIRKGNRPSYIRAMKPERAVTLYESLCCEVEKQLGRPVKKGEFGAHMKVRLVNDGPVTIIMDTKMRE
jgi:D-aminoacyl-tRNA deacylase